LAKAMPYGLEVCLEEVRPMGIFIDVKILAVKDSS